METQTNARARTVLEDCWRLTPARMAEHLTNGRFQRYRHVRFLEKKLAQAIGRGGTRLIISMPPRHGKSWLASLFTPAWFLSLWPDRNVILSSHDANLAAAWGRGVRDFLRRHQSALAIRLAEGGVATSGWRTAQGGGMFTAGIGGPVSGYGGHLLIVDDPIRNWADASSENVRQRQIDWFNSTFYTRAEPNASIIVIMTRWHERDLTGYLQTEHGDQWEVLRIPAVAEDGDALGRMEGAALCEERYGGDALERIRANIGARAWSALYQQRPASETGRIVRREWWRHYRARPDRFDEVVQSWDMAFKGTETSDYVVGQVWGRIGADRFLLDQVRGKMDFSATVRAVARLSERYPLAGRKLVEAKANGCAVIAALRESVPGLVAVEASEGKAARVRAVSAEIESGNVYLPAATLAPWVEDFVGECADFPNGKHDDQVDAMTQALKRWREEELDARTQRAGGTYLSDSESVGGGSAGTFGR